MKMCKKCNHPMTWDKYKDNLTAVCSNEECKDEIKYTFEEKVKEYFNHDKETILEIINIEEYYKVVKVKCADDSIKYFSYINNKRVFYNFGMESIDKALLALIGDNNKTGEYLNSVSKLLNVE